MEKNKEPNDMLTRYIERTDQLEETMKREFGNVHVRLNFIDTRFDGLEQRVDGLEQRFDALERKVDEGFRLAGERMDRIDARMNEGFTAIGERFNRIDETLRLILVRLDRIDQKLDDHSARIKSLEDWRNSYPS